MAKRRSQKPEMPEIDPEKWSQFESTLKRALDMPHKPHKPVIQKKSPNKKRSQGRKG